MVKYMKKILFISFILFAVFLTSCSIPPDRGPLTTYKFLDFAVIPDKCVDYNEDVCGLFDCMVDMCWCDDSSPELPILFETYISFDDEQGAIDAVNVYISEMKHGNIESSEFNLDSEFGIDPNELKVKRAVQFNNIFYNVFVEDNEGNEYVYTVAVDGTIIKTICGV